MWHEACIAMYHDLPGRLSGLCVQAEKSLSEVLDGTIVPGRRVSIQRGDAAFCEIFV